MKQQTKGKTRCATLFWKWSTSGLSLWSEHHKHFSFWVVHKAIDMGSFTTSTIWH
jgi:hypothetical protein